MKNKMKYFSEYIYMKLVENKNIFWLALPFFMMDICLRGIILNINFFPVYYPTPNIFTISWIVFFVGIILSLKGVWGKTAYWIFFIAGFMVYITNAIYYKLTGFSFSFTLLEMSGEGSGYILDAILGAGFKVYFFIVLVIAVAIISFKNARWAKVTSGKKFVKTIIAFVVIQLIAICTLGPKNAELKWNTFKNPRNIYEDFSDTNKCIKVTGLYEYTVRNIYVTFFKADEVINNSDKEFLDNIYSAENEKNESIYTGMFKDKNVIFLQLEGIDEWLLDEETMPNLYKLREESIDFKNHFSIYTGGGSTFNSEFAVNTGFTTPLSYIENVYSFHKNTFSYSMARLFKKEGYVVNAFHMNSGEFYSRGINYKSWGYDNYYGLIDVDDYSDDSYKLDRELILNKKFYNEMFKQESKFVDYIITYSPHTPFTTEKEVGKQLAMLKYEDGDIPELSEEECARLQASETDNFIGLLMDALKENGLYEDTVIVAFADHYLYTLEDKTILDKYKETSNNLINKTPFFIWSSDIEHETKNKVTMQTDILPTVLNLFGIEYNSNHYIGHDALANGYKGYVFFSDYSWYDGNVYVENGKITNGSKVTSEYVESMSGKIGEVIRKNDLTLKYNYFKELNEKKEN